MNSNGTITIDYCAELWWNIDRRNGKKCSNCLMEYQWIDALAFNIMNMNSFVNIGNKFVLKTFSNLFYSCFKRKNVAILLLFYNFTLTLNVLNRKKVTKWKRSITLAQVKTSFRYTMWWIWKVEMKNWNSWQQLMCPNLFYFQPYQLLIMSL